MKKIKNKREVLRQSGALNRRPRMVKDELFREHGFFDAEDIVQVKYEMLRRVLCDEESISTVAKRFGFSRPSFYKARSSFEDKGLLGLVPEKPGPRGAHKLTDEIVEFVGRAMEEDESFDAGRAVELIEKKFGVSVHSRSVERALNRKKKRQEERSNQKRTEQRR